MPADEPIIPLHRRFDRIGRLAGNVAMQRLFDSHVVVIGLGGVGSWAAEALARSGVGRLTLVDYDVVCVTNTNRQLPALKHTVGKSKASVLAERCRDINPQITARAVPMFFESRIADPILGGGSLGRPTWIVDAIDNITAKCQLIAACRAKQLDIVVSGGAGGRWDPTAIHTADLAYTKVDRMSAAVRSTLRRRHEFPRSGPFGIPAVYSTEPVQDPVGLQYDGDDGFRCVCPGGKNEVNDCEDKNVIHGTTAFVTGAFGLACASVVVRAIVGAAS